MSHIHLNRCRLDRRQVLRGVGASIALPLLNCMAPVAAAQPAPSKPKRSVFLYIPNGVNTLTWQIEKAGKDYEFTKPLQSLERHRADIIPISGLHHPKVLGKHHNCDKVWLTGADVPGDGGAFRNTVSADQLMAEVQGAHTRFASLELAIEGHSLAWSRDGIQIPAERDTRNIFNMLFGVERERVKVRSVVASAAAAAFSTWSRKMPNASTSDWAAKTRPNSMNISPPFARSRCAPSGPKRGSTFPSPSSMAPTKPDSRASWT